MSNFVKINAHPARIRAPIKTRRTDAHPTAINRLAPTLPPINRQLLYSLSHHDYFAPHITSNSRELQAHLACTPEATRLFRAAASGDDETLAKLLQAGVPPGLRCKDGDTPLRAAIRARDLRQIALLVYAAVAQSLRGTSAPNSDDIGSKSAEEAKTSAHLELVNQTDEHGRSAMWHAAWSGDAPGCMALLSLGASCDECDAEGISPGMAAILAGHTRLGRSLDQIIAVQCVRRGHVPPCSASVALARIARSMRTGTLARGAQGLAPAALLGPVERKQERAQQRADAREAKRTSKHAVKIRAKILQMRRARAFARRNRTNRDMVRPTSAACWEEDEAKSAQTEQPPNEVTIVTRGGIHTRYNQQHMKSTAGTSESKASEPSHGSPSSSGASSVRSWANSVYEPVGKSYGQCDERSDDECCASVSSCSSDSDGDMDTDSDSESSSPGKSSGPSSTRRIYAPEPVSSVYASLDRASHVLTNTKGGFAGWRQAGISACLAGVTGAHDAQLPPVSLRDALDRWAEAQPSLRPPTVMRSGAGAGAGAAFGGPLPTREQEQFGVAAVEL